MNIMFLIFSYQTGGIERLLIDMANTLSQKGQHISLCIINDRYEDALLANYLPEVEIFKLERPCQTGNRLPYMLQLAKLIHEKHIEILHCQDVNCTLFALPAKLLYPSLSIVDTVHDTFAFDAYPAYKVWLEQLLCKRIIAISESVKSSITKHGVSNQKINIIYNAIDTNRFYLTRQPIHTKIVMGNVARILPRVKGQQILLDAVLILKKKYPDIQCLFAGKAAPEQEQEYQDLLTFVTKHSLEHNISFLGDVQDIPSFLKDIDLFILPSIYEGFGISLIEAMSMGIPCIASNIAGPAEIITDSHLGLLFESENPNALADCIDYAITHIDTFDRTYISNYIHNHFSMHIMTEQLIQLYQTLL